MPTIVVPFHGPEGKRRLAPLPHEARAAIGAAMLADVLAASVAVAPTVVVAPAAAHAAVEAVARARVELVADPGGGQGAAVAAALVHAAAESAVVVNADLPCTTPEDLAELLAALGSSAVAVVEAVDGTTNALALASAALFRPLYGPGSAARFRALATGSVTLARPNLRDDVDTLDDLRRLAGRLGPRTRRALAAVDAGVGAAA